jgi:hypothetical protein
MTPHRHIIADYLECTGKVIMGDSSETKVVGKGWTDYLGSILYVPDLKYSLISISALDELGMTITIGGGQVLIHKAGVKEPWLKGFRYNGLYWLDCDFAEKIFEACRPKEVSCLARCSNCYSDGVVGDKSDCLCQVPSTVSKINGGVHGDVRLFLNILRRKKIRDLHNRWGHASYDKIRTAIRKGMVTGHNLTSMELATLETLSTCVPCKKGKMKASKVDKGSSEKHWDVLEKIGIDFKGYFPIQYHGFRGFFLLSDCKSHYLYVYLVKKRSEAGEALRAFYEDVMTYHNKIWRILQADSDSVFISETVRQWLDEKHIKLQLSVPYKHWQNGQIERDVQNVMDMARTVMADSKAPPSYWVFAVQYACYVLNRTPVRGEDKTPLEAITGAKPDVSHFVPFFCPGVYHCTKEERKGKPWAYKAEPCRMLGYDEATKGGYKVLKLRTHEIVTRKDCVFDDEIDVKELLDETGLRKWYESLDEEVDWWDEMNDPDEDDGQEIPELSTSGGGESGNKRDQDVETQMEQPLSKKPRPQVDESDEGSTTVADEDGDEDEYDETWGFKVTFDDGDSSLETQQSVSPKVINAGLQAWYEEVCFTVAKAVALPPQPKSVKEALAGKYSAEWRKAIDSELAQMDERGVLRWIDGKKLKGKPLKSKIVLRVSYDNDMKLKFKARLVVCGYAQRKGIDFHETFAPTTSTFVVLLLLSIAASFGYHCVGFDVGGAFLEGLNDVNLSIIFPREVTPSDIYPRYYEVIKSLYGEKQAPKIWNDHFNRILVAMGCERCAVDCCLYRWRLPDGRDLFVTIHVDDGLVIAKDKMMLDSFIENLRKHLNKIVVYESLPKFLGMNISHGNGYCMVDQSAYIVEKIQGFLSDRDIKFGKETFRKGDLVPMQSAVNLRIQPSDERNGSILPMAGLARFLADRTRPDILVAVGEFSSGRPEHPSEAHVKVALRTLRYVASTPYKGLKLGGNFPVKLFGFCDASFVSDGDSRSRLGGCLFLNEHSGAFQSFSKKDTTVSHSSTEAEIKALDELIRQIQSVRDLLEFLGCEQQEPTKIYMDNASAIEICRTLKSMHKTKHINVRINYIREVINSRMVEIHFVGSQWNVADVLTKPLPWNLFERHCNCLMNGLRASGDYQGFVEEQRALGAFAVLSEC